MTCGSIGPEFLLCVRALYNVWEFCTGVFIFSVGALYNVWELWTGVRIMCGSFV